MKILNKTFLWFWLMSKRLYRKISFLAIMVLIPVLVLGYSAAAREDSGMITVALAQEGEDSIASQIIEEIQSDSQLLRVVNCESPLAAENLVRTGKADTAWIFPEDMQEHFQRYVAWPHSENAFITVLEREENVALMLAREKLSAALHKYCAQSLYLEYIRENIPQMSAVSDQELLAYYEGTAIADELFVFDDREPAGDMDNAQNVHYLMAPIRGLLAVVILLCGLASAMYFIQDSEKGTFSWVPQTRQPVVELGCQLVSVMNISVAALVSLAAIGMAASVGRELLVLVLYSLCVAVFCMTVRRLCGTVRVLGTLLPVQIVIVLLICPVFFDLGALRQLQYLFPPTYYINAVYNDKYLLYMLLYTFVSGTVYVLAGKILKRS